MRTSVLSAAAMWLVFLGGCAPTASANVTGLYLVDGGTTLEVLQLVEQTDGTLAGRLEYYAVKENGEFESVSRALSGSARDGALVLKMDRSMETLFTSTALSGQIKGKRLELTWEGGIGTYQQSDIDDRNKILERLHSQLREIQWNLVVEQHQKLFAEASSAADAMQQRVPATQAAMKKAKEDYRARIDAIREKQQQIARLQATNIGYDREYQISSEVYAIESEIYRLDADVRNLLHDLNRQIALVMEKSDQVSKFCELIEEAANDLSFCIGMADLNQTIADTRNSISPEFDAWEELTGQKLR